MAGVWLVGVKKGRLWGQRGRVQVLGVPLSTKGSYWRILSKEKIKFRL